MSGPDYQLGKELGEIKARLEAIERTIADGNKRHDTIDGRIDRLDLLEAKRVGVFATVSAVAGILGSAITLTLPTLLKKLGAP